MGAFLFLSAWASTSTQTLDLSVNTRGLSPDIRVYAETTWRGELRRGELSDSGQDPADKPGDNIRVLSWSGPSTRSLTVRLLADSPDGGRVVLWTGTPELLGDHDRLTFVVAQTAPLRLQQVVSTPTAPAPVSDPATGSLVGAAWSAVMFLYVLGLGLTRRA